MFDLNSLLFRNLTRPLQSSPVWTILMQKVTILWLSGFSVAFMIYLHFYLFLIYFFLFVCYFNFMHFILFYRKRFPSSFIIHASLAYYKNLHVYGFICISLFAH